MTTYRFVGGPNDGKTYPCEVPKCVFPWMVTRQSVTFPTDGAFRKISLCEAVYSRRKRMPDGEYEYHFDGMKSEPLVERFAGLDADGYPHYVPEMSLREWDKLHPPLPDEVWPFCYEESKP